MVCAFRDLADRDSDGKLSKEDFAVAMYLIRQKISGKPLPETLPPSLIPPSERTGASKPLPPEPVPEPEEDIFSDPPPAPAPTLVAPTPSPARSNSRMSGPRNGPRTAAAATAAPATPPPPASPEPPPPPPHGLPPEDDEPRSGTPPPPYTETDDLDLL